MTPEKVRLLIVEARFYDDLADELLRGASDVISAHGAGFDARSSRTRAPGGSWT